MSRILKALVVACCFAVDVGTFYSDIDERYSERRNRRESVKKTIVVYNGYVPVEDHLECVPTGNVVQMLRCNGVPQLPGGSDETNCTSTRTGRRPGSFKCLNGIEIWDMWRCDGHYHCEDGSDETDCEDYGPRPPKDLFYLCNGVVECRGGWDEVNCPPDYTPEVELVPPSFTCSNERDSPELTVRFKCDEQKDCADGSDEENCEKKFRCKNNEKTLLLADDYCDGLTFCGSQQENPSCILVNGPSNHVLKYVSQSNPIIEIYEYVIDEDSSSVETDSYTVTYEENSNPEPEQTDPNLSQEHGNPHSQHKELDQESSNSLPELTIPTNSHQLSTKPIQEQFKTESTIVIEFNKHSNYTDSHLEFSTSYSELIPIDKSTSLEYPSQHDNSVKENNNDNVNDEDNGGENNSDVTVNKEDRNTTNDENGNKDNISSNNNSDSYNYSGGIENNNNDDDDDNGDSNDNDDYNEHFVEESENKYDNKYSSAGNNYITGAGSSAGHLYHLCMVISLILLNIS